MLFVCCEGTRLYDGPIVRPEVVPSVCVCVSVCVVVTGRFQFTSVHIENTVNILSFGTKSGL